MRSPARLVLVVTGLFLQACVAIKSYPGATLPDDQVARIGPQVGYRVFAINNVEIGSLDGSVVGEPLAVLEVLPGRHLVGARYSGGYYGVSKTGTGLCYMVVEAKAGRFYKVGGNLVKDEHGWQDWQCWLSDEASGTRTAGVFVKDADLPRYESLTALMDAIAAGTAEATKTGGLWVNYYETQPIVPFSPP